MKTCKMKTAHASYSQADYSPENWATLIAAKAAGDTEIEHATSVDEVTAALNNAKTAMAAVPTLLDDAKVAAHAALAGYNQEDYSPENWAILIAAKTAGDTDIENAACVEDVMKAAKNAKEAMAAVNTLLIDAKIAAHMSLNTALADYVQSDYSPDNWTVLMGFKTAGDAAVDLAIDLAEVEAAQAAAIAGKAAVQTIAQALAAAKAAAHEALKAALGDYEQVDDVVVDGTGLTEETGESAPEAVPVTDSQEAQCEVELLIFETETEVVGEGPEDDAPAASQEESAAKDNISDIAEENANTEQLEPEQENTTESESTEPESTEPESTEPESTEPESTEPESTEPESTEPESTESESTESESTESESTESESTESESTESESTESESTESESTESESTKSESTEPESTESQSTESESTESESTESESMESTESV